MPIKNKNHVIYETPSCYCQIHDQCQKAVKNVIEIKGSIKKVKIPFIFGVVSLQRIKSRVSTIIT